jgi:hypothetical protein
MKIILSKIEKLWSFNPDQRLGQLLFNYTRIGTRIPGELGVVKDPFYYEDTDIEKDLDLAIKAHEQYYDGFKAKGVKKTNKFIK